MADRSGTVRHAEAVIATGRCAATRKPIQRRISEQNGRPVQKEWQKRRYVSNSTSCTPCAKGFSPGDETRTVATPEIRRQAILSVVTTKEEPDPDEPKPGVNDVDPVIPRDPDKYLARWLHSHPEESQAPKSRQPKAPRRRPD
jgi:hypothetical protein